MFYAFKVLISGFHIFDELECWSSYLINIDSVGLVILRCVECAARMSDSAFNDRLYLACV